MAILPWIENTFLKVTDFAYAYLPQAVPGKEKLIQCEIISHRGDHDNRDIFENTLPAFDRIRAAGCGGIEFDVRWTKDLKPVVFHDRNLNRVFGSNDEIAKLKLSEIKVSFPLIPSLEKVVDAYGKKLHLMVEIKEEFYPDPEYQHRVLKDIFAPLKPRDDFHFISMNPMMFEGMAFFPPQTFLPIAVINATRLSEIALMKGYQGIAGHYLFITNTFLKRHPAVGTGIVNSKKCFFREVNRGIKWIFSGNAIELQAIRTSLLKKD